MSTPPKIIGDASVVGEGSTALDHGWTLRHVPNHSQASPGYPGTPQILPVGRQHRREREYLQPYQCCLLPVLGVEPGPMVLYSP